MILSPSFYQKTKNAICLDRIKIFIPIHVNERFGHWVLLIRFIKFTNDIITFKIYYIDSKNSINRMNTIKTQSSRTKLCNIFTKYQQYYRNLFNILNKVKLNVMFTDVNIL